ncbi:hypothetical protein OGAPHI_003520 [Ogataea philodendri]|uniref:RNA exonuclease 4 n=1 Tax=Ogataea philodendri TaxID=1378263 RepID=A0A9P8P6M6_9ASCO|nr:uncharacterized protein OGAPHI_003520 [Ogataea philodendri]KAH3666523.1 hypothetical protein OGAPHI_003520 [Ogataea philodendri]
MSSALSSNWKRLQKKRKRDDSGKQEIKTRPKFTKNGSNKPKASITVSDLADHTPKLQKLDVAKPVSNRQKEIGKFVAMDCEFVGVGEDGVRSVLARVSLVNYHGVTIYDQFVIPTEKVTDWRTAVSGVTRAHMKDAVTFKEAQEKVAKILDGRILVGHDVGHDLDVLMLSHSRFMTRDTAKHTPFRKKYAAGKTPSLKKLCKEILGVEIQSGQHSSVEDARATMMIYKSAKNEFENQLQKTRGAQST